MKIAIERSQPLFWVLHCLLHFFFLMGVLFFVRWLWAILSHISFQPDWGELLFECLIYSVALTIAKLIRYYIGKKRYEKNPVDRRKNHLFRE